MSDVAAPATRKAGNLAPAATGLGSLMAFMLVAETLIRAGVISRFIVPPPS